MQKMKDTEREKITVELAAWQLRKKKQTQVRSQEENQNSLETVTEQQEKKISGGKVESLPVCPNMLSALFGLLMTSLSMFRSKQKKRSEKQEKTQRPACTKTCWQHSSHIYSTGFPNSPEGIQGARGRGGEFPCSTHHVAISRGYLLLLSSHIQNTTGLQKGSAQM